MACNNKCGEAECCQGWFIPVRDPNYALLLLYRGAEIRIDGAEYVAKIDLPCSFNDKRTGQCIIHSQKPTICREWPKSGIYPGGPDACPYTRLGMRWIDYRKITIDQLKKAVDDYNENQI